jgi:hypothetical protein
MEDNARRMRNDGVAYAGRDLKETEETLNQVRDQPRTFSRWEAIWGEPDPKFEKAERIEA